MLFRTLIVGCIFGCIANIAPFLFAQDHIRLSDEDEELVVQLLSLPDIKRLKPPEQKRIFEQMQHLIGMVQKATILNDELLKNLCEKQCIFFAYEKKAYIDLATYFYRKDDFQNTVSNAQKALSAENIFYSDPQNQLDVTAYTYLGQHALENEKLLDAYNFLSQALVRNSQIVLPYFLMGNTCFKLKKFSESIEAYTKAFSLDPTPAYPIDYFFFALGLHKAGYPEKAEQILLLGILAYPNEEGLHLNRGFVLREMNNLFLALLEFQMEMFLLGPEGRFYQSAHTNAMATEKLILQRNDVHEMELFGHIIKWRQYMDGKKYPLAIDELLALKQSLGSSHWVINFYLEQAYFLIEDYEKAQKVLDEMETTNPGIVLTNLLLADVYLRMANIEQAKNYYSRASAIAPDNFRVKELFDRISAVKISDNDSQN
ncbi:MAG: tetratricopeptide repeat protein [bacterium]|nr:tetratricopeptide repeat protein [bacterium]